jgi:hypothetical protein
MLGIFVTGYFKPRYAEGVLDELEINTLALACGDTKVLLMSADLCGINQKLGKILTEDVCAATGLPREGVYIHTTHTHTGPAMPGRGCDEAVGELIDEYWQFPRRKFADAAVMALADLKPAKMGYGIGDAPNISFIRRFRMKDGSIKTNPGVNNPDIVAPVGEVDTRVNVVRFDREGGDTLVFVNFGDHPDVVGGNLISADWPRFLRETVEKTLDDTKCVFFNGAQGDVNHVNVHPTGGYLNDMFMDFDDVARGYGHSRYMGRVVAGGVLQAFDKVKYVDVQTLKADRKTIRIPSNRATAEELVLAHKYNDLHNAGRDADIPYKGMMLTTVVAEAGRMVRLENGPDFFDMELSGVAVGPVALIGIPGEPFNGVGLGLKAAEGWELICPCCLVNGSEAYFPMRECYEEGGYEARSSSMKAGCAEQIIEEGTQLLDSLR